jgi:transposase
MPPQKRLSRKTVPSLIHPKAAGIDVGSRFHIAAIPDGLDPEPVQKFSSFTGDLKRLCDWLCKHKIDTVAMESTGIYWIPVYELLEGAGIKVFLVNARHAKCVPGRKSDSSDAQWLQQLHSWGLLKASFQPEEGIAHLRSLLRLRDNLVKSRSSHQQHIQKALMQMNLQLHHVVNDVMGKTGRQIIDAILAGERRPEVLAGFRDRRCKNDASVIAEALHGHFRDDHLFELSVAVRMFDEYSLQILSCEARSQKVLEELAKSKAGSQAQSGISLEPSRKRRSGYSFDPSALINALVGTDMSRIYGLGPGNLLTIISECGTDMEKWPSAKHFTSWLGLAPQNKISGGRILSSRTRPGSSRAASAFWIAALAVARSQTALGAFSRRLAARCGKPKAHIATARKLAVLFYRSVRYGIDSEDPGAARYEEKQKRDAITSLAKRASKLGFSLVEALQTPPLESIVVSGVT